MKFPSIQVNFSDIEKKFWISELKNNHRFFILMYALIGCIELLMLFAMMLANSNSEIPNIDKSYSPFYIIGIAISIISIIIISNMKKPNRFIQIVLLSVTMLWACLFAINDINNGFHSYVLAQVLVLSAASIRFPGRVHFCINSITFLLYAILLYPLHLEQTVYLSNVINTGILFFFSSFIILFINRSRLQNFKDNATMQQQQKQLLHMTQYDELTQLYSRSMILNYLESALDKDSKIGCIMTDIDNFKKYNDAYGHHTGDEVLRHTAVLLKEIVQKYEGKAGRYGGEEFLVVLIDCDEALLREVLEDLQQNYHNQKNAHAITLSMGGTLAQENEKADIVISRADKAMYRAKNAGKDTFRIL